MMASMQDLKIDILADKQINSMASSNTQFFTTLMLEKGFDHFGNKPSHGYIEQEKIWLISQT